VRYILLLILLCVPATGAEPFVRVYTYTNKDNLPDSRGSGVMVSHNQILTNFHVVRKRRKDRNSVAVRFSDGFRSWATVEVVNTDLDVSLIRTHPHTATPLEFGGIAKGIVTTHGFGYDYEFMTPQGEVGTNIRVNRNYKTNRLNTKPDPNGLFFQINGLPSRPGDSGAAVTMGGLLVGIVFGRGEATYCIHINPIQKWLTGKLMNAVAEKSTD